MTKRTFSSIRFEKEQLDELVQAENSCVETKEQNYHLALHPFHLTNINESIKDILNKGIAKYDKKLDGILLGYQNIKLLSQAGTISYDSFFIHIDIVASFYLFKPEVGKVLHGIVNKKSEDHVGCLVHNTFNVSLPQPEDDDEAWSKVELKNEILFRITCINLEGRLPYIRAELVSVISEDDSGFSTSEENPYGRPKKIIFQSDDEQEVDVSESKKKKKDKRKKNIELEADNEQKKKKKRKHSTVEYVEEESTKSSKKKKSKHKDNEEVINETNIEDDEQESKKRKKHKHKKESHHEEEVHNLGTNISLDDEVKEKKKSKKHNVKYELEDTSLEYHSKKKVKQERKDSLEELTDAVLERTLRDLSEDVNTETQREKKIKKQKTEASENDELDTTLPELDLEMLFETDDKTQLIIDNKFVMADDEDKKMKKRRSAFVSNGLENKADLLADSDLEKIYKDVDKSKQEKTVKKRRRSTSSDDFQTQKKKKKIQ